jgi:hypothetical protein
LADLLDADRMPSLRGFLEAGDYAAWDRLFEGQRALAYTASYSLFFFFCAQPAVFAYLTAWLDSKPIEGKEDLNHAFAEYLDRRWPGGLAAFEKTWHAWIKSKAAGTAPAGAPTGRPSVRPR